jgi:hypothetical protein
MSHGRQREREPAAMRPQRVHRIDAARLQEDREVVLLREGGRARLVAFGQGLQVAEDERDRVVARDEFHLRNVAASVHAVDQRGQRGDLRADLPA